MAADYSLLFGRVRQNQTSVIVAVPHMIYRPHLRATAAVCIFLCAFDNSLAQVEVTTADAILQRMENAYTNAKAYADNSSAIYRNLDGSERLQVEFRIWFVRGGQFRIDAESQSAGASHPRREVMWTEGAVARSWSTDKALSSHPKIKLIGSRMFGAYAYHIPSLLESGYAGPQRLHQLSHPLLAGEETFEATACYRIRGKWRNDVYEVWLGKSDYLVRKIVAKYRDHVLEEIHRNIVLDREIAADVFRFAPENEPPAKR